MNCLKCDERGFCTKYSNDAVVWRCENKEDCASFEKAPIKYPCKTCTRVKYPKSCENKKCWEWKQWFIDRWDDLRRCYYG
jgi:hypothetical protein